MNFTAIIDLGPDDLARGYPSGTAFLLSPRDPRAQNTKRLRAFVDDLRRQRCVAGVALPQVGCDLAAAVPALADVGVGLIQLPRCTPRAAIYDLTERFGARTVLIALGASARGTRAGYHEWPGIGDALSGRPKGLAGSLFGRCGVTDLGALIGPIRGAPANAHALLSVLLACSVPLAGPGSLDALERPDVPIPICIPIRAMLQAIAERPSIREGELSVLETELDHVMVFTRRAECGPQFGCVANFGDEPATVWLPDRYATTVFGQRGGGTDDSVDVNPGQAVWLTA